MNPNLPNQMSGVRRLARRPSLSLMVSLLALVIASSTAGYAAVVLPPNSVGTKHLKDNAVISRKVKDKALYAKDVAPGQFVRPASPAWRTLPVASGYVRFGSAYPPLQYRKDETGRVWLRGVATKVSGLPAVEERIATLPAGYRPTHAQHFLVLAGPPFGAFHLRLQPQGDLLWYTTPSNENDFVDLGSVTFLTR